MKMETTIEMIEKDKRKNKEAREKILEVRNEITEALFNAEDYLSSAKRLDMPELAKKIEEQIQRLNRNLAYLDNIEQGLNKNKALLSCAKDLATAIATDDKDRIADNPIAKAVADKKLIDALAVRGFTLG